MCPKVHSKKKTAKERNSKKIPQFHLRSPSLFRVFLNRRVHAHLEARKRLTLEWILNAIIAVKVNRLATYDVGEVQFSLFEYLRRRHIHENSIIICLFIALLMFFVS